MGKGKFDPKQSEGPATFVSRVPSRSVRSSRCSTVYIGGLQTSATGCDTEAAHIVPYFSAAYLGLNTQPT
jgi:hypothetical protein